jgi:MYXO-CTERM domain-containing protein
MRSLALITLTVSLALVAGEASAHIQLMSPIQRHTEQKAGPCGVGPDDARGPNVTTYKPGETITVVFDEHVNHPGHFRISFDDDGHDGFADPEAYDDYYTNEYVLLDQIADKEGGIYEVEVTLPNIECENCTLQVQQTMTDKPPFGPAGGVDFYWQCADIRLEGELAGTTTDTTTTGEPGSSSGDETFGGPEPSEGGETTFGTATGTDGEGEGTEGAGTAGGESTAGPDPDPTGGGETGATGGADTGTATGTATATATDPSTDDDDKGCGCRGDAGDDPVAGGAGWLALLVAPLAWRRRRARA